MGVGFGCKWQVAGGWYQVRDEMRTEGRFLWHRPTSWFSSLQMTTTDLEING
jgi:hypothetical protein